MEEILVNVTPQETRVAIIENGVLQEMIVERTRRRGLVGNVYKGRVSRVLPGMGAAFVDIGLERTGFLHVSDLQIEAEADAEPSASDTAIDELLREGQEIVVQIAKDPIGTKGPRMTTRICLPSRYLVFMPDSESIGISQRIESQPERARLRDILLRHDPALVIAEGLSVGAPANGQGEAPGNGSVRHGGFIVRTAAEGIDEASLLRDMEFLRRLWQSLQVLMARASVPALVYEDLPVALRTLRDRSAAGIEKVRIDSRETFVRALEFAQQFIPDLVARIEHYPGERPILDLYSTEDEIQKALERRVELKSGGHLIIDQTEAMTTIDVNTGGFVGARNLEETIFKTNLEAAQSIARQLRLRNLGGIIIIDFIDMTDLDHRRQVLRALERSLERDHSKITISEITSLGLVQLTRKRTRESLEHVLCEPCPVCQGRGSVKSVETICYEIYREILREVRQFDARELLVVASATVVNRMMYEDCTSVAELEAFIRRSIRFQTEASYTQEQYDVVLL